MFLKAFILVIFVFLGSLSWAGSGRIEFCRQELSSITGVELESNGLNIDLTTPRFLLVSQREFAGRNYISGLYQVYSRATGEKVGHIYYAFNFEKQTSDFTLAFEKRFRGLGVGTEVKFHVLKWAFKNFPIEKAQDIVVETDLPSLALHAKLGYKIVDTRKENEPGDGRVYELEVSREEFQRLEQKVRAMGDYPFFMKQPKRPSP